MFSKLNRLFLAGFVLVSPLGVIRPGHAETSQTPVSAQTIKLEAFKARFDSLKASVAEMSAFNKALASAEKTQAGARVAIDLGSSFSGWGTVVGALSGTALYGMRAFPDAALVKNLNSPTKVIFIGSVVVAVVGIASLGGGKYLVDITQPDIDSAKRDIEQRLAYIAEEKAAISKLAEGYGATINQNIISWEGVPEGLRVFGGSSLNLNDLGGFLPKAQ